jgi:flagella synthesis protein FlgN
VATPIFDTLPQECQTMENLLAVMKEEQAHLIKADIEALSAITEIKNELLMHMGAHANARHAALEKAGLPTDDNSMRAALQADENVASYWKKLLEFGKKAKELNRVNGLLINKQLAHNQGAISALKISSQQNNVYGRDGQAKSMATHRHLVIG